MSEIVIKAENLGKKYIIGHEKLERYTALRDVIARKTKQIIGKTRQIFQGGQLIAGNELEEFWALREINFDIKQGDRIGIIGRNGAGKSTLLKILSRITEPTTGRVQIKGRIASLLEVGTGFHQELSGRENIFLNGAILGMNRAEIIRKFDEIVDFSGVEKFLDTPVKRYSSGMYVRLAFAVAAHLEPEILIVDEVLAVGDIEFQKKCLGKMESVSTKEGRTVLFVSHNMGAIKELCTRGILLKDGIIIEDNNVKEVLNEYVKGLQQDSRYIAEIEDNKTNGQFLSIKIFNKNGIETNIFEIDDSPYIEIEYILKKDFYRFNVSMWMYDTLDTNIFVTADSDCNSKLLENRIEGKYKVHLELNLWNLNSGTYKLKFQMGIVNLELFDSVELCFRLKNNSFYNIGERSGVILSMNKWNYQ